jgi:hypothetical protein
LSLAATRWLQQEVRTEPAVAKKQAAYNVDGFAFGGAICVPSPNELPLNRITKAKNKVMKPKNEMSAGTGAEQRTEDDVCSSPPADAKPHVTCMPSVAPNHETSFDVSKYGFVFSRGDIGEVEFYRREFDGFSVELMVSADVYSLSLINGGVEMVLVNRYKVSSQEQLDFLIFNGRVGSWFNRQP